MKHWHLVHTKPRQEARAAENLGKVVPAVLPIAAHIVAQAIKFGL